MERLKVSLALLLLLALAVSSCSGGAHQTSGVFIEGEVGGDAETLNWILAGDASSHGYVGHLIDTLATYDNEFRIQLRCLARDIEVSPDGLVYTVAIRDDLKWSDGSPVTAEDYVYTLNSMILSDWLSSPYKSTWQEEVNGRLVNVTARTVNSNTFTITRQTVEPEFVYTIYDLMPYPKSLASKYEGDIDAFTKAPELNNPTYTGNLGPYLFVEWVRNDRYVIKRNPEYYLGKDTGAPYFDQYIIKLFGTSATAQAALEAGDITYTGIEPAQVSKFKNLENIQVYTVPTGSYTLLAYNQRANGWEGLKKKAVRQALSMAISKKKMVESVLLGFGDPAFSFIPATSPWYSDQGLAKYGVEPLYNQRKAQELLLEEGYGQMRSDGTLAIVDKNGEPLNLVLATNHGSKVGEDMAFLIRKELNDIGIEVELKLVPWPTLLRQFVMNKAEGSNQEPAYNNGPDAVSEEPWDLLLMGFTNDLLAPSGSELFFSARGGLNYFGYSSAAVDGLFRRARSAEALDRNARQQIYIELSQLLSEEQPVDFLVFHRANHGFQKSVKGIEPGISMGYNYYLWHFE